MKLCRFDAVFFTDSKCVFGFTCSVLPWKDSGQAFLTEVLRQFCRTQKCLSTHKK